MLYEIMIPIVLVATFVQVFIRYGFGTRIPIGDEIEYLRRVSSNDPFGPSPFLRVPVMVMLTWLVSRTTSHTEARMRDVLGFIAVLTACCLGMAGYLAWGGVGALVVTLLFIFLPDRMVLSQHLWPDALLALWQAGVLVCLMWSIEVAPLSPWIFGFFVAASAMTRIDGLAMAPALTLVAVLRQQDLASVLPGIWVPTAIALALLTLIHAVRYRIAWPDTTLLFNLSLMAEEHAQQNSESAAVQGLTRTIWQKWEKRTHGDRVACTSQSVVVLIRQPGRVIRGIADRIWQMLGPDTFGMNRLLDPVTGAYPEITPRTRALLVRALQISFPLLAALGLAGAIFDEHARICLVPGVVAFVVACLFHARTRFRYAVLPGLALAAVAGLRAVFDASTREWALGIFLVALLLLLMAPERKENEAPSPA